VFSSRLSRYINTLLIYFDIVVRVVVRVDALI